MKSVFTIIYLLLFCLSNAQDAKLSWAKQLGGSTNDYGYSIAVDASGNVYTTGTFAGTADFNPDPAVTYNLTSAGSDIFISKLDASGNFVWAKQFGGPLNDDGISIAVDVLGNVYGTGTFAGTVDFNPDAAVTYNLTSAGGLDIFIIKLDAAGNFIWTKQIGGGLDDHVTSIKINSFGVFTTGYFYGSSDFNPDPTITNNLTSLGDRDIFISKLDVSGNFVWAKRMGGTATDVSTSIAIDALGNVYTTGYFHGTSDFNPDPAVTYNFTSNITNPNYNDIFISKLDASGNFIWAKQIGGSVDNGGLSLDLDAQANVYTTGYFSGITDFNPDPAITNNFTSKGSYDIYVNKLDASGNFLWTKQLGGSVYETSSSIAVDASGVYTTGYFQGPTDFNPDPIVSYNLTSYNLYDIYVNKLDASGNFVWAKELGGNGFDYGLSIALDANGNVYNTGYFFSTLSDFNPDPAVTYNLTNAGSSDAFVVKLSQATGGALPISFSSLKAFQNNTGVQVDWNLESESNMSFYEVEKSADGINFTKKATIIPKGNSNNAVSYDWFDAYPVDGNNFYKIKAVEVSGNIKYSSIINVNIRKGKSNIVVNLSPVTNGVLNLRLLNEPKGTYNIRLFSNAGQLLYSNKFEHPGGSLVQKIQLSSKMTSGIYLVQVTGGENNMTKKVIFK